MLLNRLFITLTPPPIIQFSPISIFSLLIALLPKNVFSFTTTPPFITPAVEIWQLSPTILSCSISAFVLIMQFFPTVAFEFTSA